MGLLSGRLSRDLNVSLKTLYPISFPVLLLLVFFLHLGSSCANEVNQESVPENDESVQSIVNPLDSDCYDWRGNNIPCEFKRPYAELLFYKSKPGSRFTDNNDGTVTDNLTGLVWLKNTNCVGMRNWQDAVAATKKLKDGDCGPDPDLVLSDGSSAGEWRLPTMKQLCTLIDFSRRNPALPKGHMFANFPIGYHWSATTLDYHPEMAWIVYFESGTTCYENVKNRAGYAWPIRTPKQ